MEAVRFQRLAYRVAAYQGVIQGRLINEMEKPDFSTRAKRPNEELECTPANLASLGISEHFIQAT